jgi:HD-GYP domain-containing protein (c-di-GMP phosphodiesterase class II)
VARLDEILATFDRHHEGEFYIPRPDGTRCPVVASGRPLRCASMTAGYRLVTLIDIADLHSARERAQEQYREVARLSDTVLEQALALKSHAKLLEKRVRQRTRDLYRANMDAITMLAVACEAKDDDTGAHVRRIRRYSMKLARALGRPQEEIERIGYSSVLHDVGKIHVADEILKKPGPLTPDERRIMEQHTLAGERILSISPFFELARQIARSHQENWDGSGYPDGLHGEQIPFAARIVRLVDVFDALTSARVYKPPWPPREAVAEIRNGRGRMFEPPLVDVFLDLVERGKWPMTKHLLQGGNGAPARP